MVFNKQTIFDFMDDVNKASQEFAVAMEAVIDLLIIAAVWPLAIAYGVVRKAYRVLKEQ